MRKLKSDKLRISYMALYRPNGELASVMRFADSRKGSMEAFARIDNGFEVQPISLRQAKRLASRGIKIDKYVHPLKDLPRRARGGGLFITGGDRWNTTRFV